MLIDDYAVAVAQMEAAKAVVDALKAKIVEQGLGEHTGDKFSVKVSSHERGTLDSAMVREMLTKKQIEKATRYTTVTVVSRPKLFVAAAA